MNDNLNQTGAEPKTNAQRQKAWRVKKSKTHVEFNVWVRLENLHKAKELLKQLG
tara:strand:- start:679 stop:840 length:162 start_codon:yes stop_codon:yes gene_type:complete